MLILKFTILSMSMPENDIYDLTIVAMMHFVFTFDLPEMESTMKKYELVFCLAQKPLLLDHLLVCPSHRGSKKGKAIEVELLEERDSKSLLTTFFWRLCPSICAAKNFCVALVEPLESRFTASPDFSDINHVCCHACAVILIEKKFGFSSGLHRFDTISLPVFALEVVDKIAYRYS